MVRTLVCFIRAAKFGGLSLFLPSKVRALRGEGCFHANERTLILLYRKMKTNIVERGLLTIISECEVDLASVCSAYALMNKIHCSNTIAFGRYLYDFATVTIIAVSKLKHVGERDAAIKARYLMWRNQKSSRDTSWDFEKPQRAGHR